MEKEKELCKFESDVNQVLDLVINSLYSNREIFLRELISNAADASDKLRFLALSDENLYEGEEDSKIEIDSSEKLKTITIRDYGIGMNRDEVVKNLGTIARSGTKDFFNNLSKEQKGGSDLVGQFGVGFYAAFIVASEVVVTSRKAGDKESEGVRWSSEGKGSFTVEKVKKKKRGTEIILYLKDDAKEFSDLYSLRSIVKRYSDHISVPIYMPKAGGATGFEVVNQATAMWRKNKREIKKEEYIEFYKNFSGDIEEPMKWIHTKAEGKLEYTSLLYIPSSPPFDMWDRNAKLGVKLYVKRVLIMEDTEDLLPRYLRFVRGIVDTDDIPLNVSRELLQKNKNLDLIKGASVKKVLSALETLSKKGSDEYIKFWKLFGNVLKEGIIEDSALKDRIAALLRFTSSTDAEMTSLEGYIERMKEDQKFIYYLTGESLDSMRNSPYLELFKEKNIEVLLMHEPIDEWVVGHLPEFSSKQLKSISQSESISEELGVDKAKNEKADEPTPKIFQKIKDNLGEHVTDVVVSRRLTDSLVCLVNPEDQMSANLQRVLQAAGQNVPKSKRVLEINVSHPLFTIIEAEQDLDSIKDWSNFLYEQSLISEGGKISDPGQYISSLNKLMINGFSS